MNRKLAVLLLALGAASAHALDAAVTTLDPAARQPAASPAEQEMLVRGVFGVLLGEMALQRGKPDVALGAYVDLAQRSQEPKAFERASEIALHFRQSEVALDLARRWVKREPASFRAQQALTSALLQTGRSEEIGEQLARMLRLDQARLGENLLGLNRLLARQTDKQMVLQLVDRLTTPYRNLAEAHFALAQAALIAGERLRARVESARMLELKPDWERGVMLRAQVLAQDAPAEAIALLRDYLSRFPEADEPRLSLARLLLAGKHYAEARQEFDRLLTRSPEAASDVLFPAAMLALQQQDHVAARQLLERLLASNYPDKASIRFFLGQLEEEANQPEAALAHYRAVDSGAQYLPARSRAAQLLLRQGRSEEALQWLRSSEGKTAEEKRRLALAESALLREGKRYAEAFSRLETALKEAPEDGDLLYEQAMLAERLGRQELFEQLLQRLLALQPEHAHALNALGYTWADQNRRLDEAEKLLRRASELAPDDPFIMDSLGWLLFRQGKLPAAEKTLRAAYTLRADPEIAAHLGEVLWQSGLREEATRLWREAAKAHPDNEALRAVLRKFLP